MKRTIIITCLYVFALCLGIASYAHGEVFMNDQQSEVKNDDFGIFIEKEKENSTQEINLFDKSVTVTYKETFNQNNKSIDKRADSYGTYDIYIENSNQYIYLYNTSIMCGYKANTVYGEFLEEAKAISKDIVKEKSYEFLKNAVPNYFRYNLNNITYDEKEGIYIVEYVSFLDNIKTDDKCIVWITAAGNVGAYSAFNLERYIKFEGLKFNYEDAEKKFYEKLNNRYYKLIDKYITLTDDGELVFAFHVYFDKESTSDIIQIPLN